LEDNLAAAHVVCEPCKTHRTKYRKIFHRSLPVHVKAPDRLFRTNIPHVRLVGVASRRPSTENLQSLIISKQKEVSEGLVVTFF
jgi:hypothetical protein